MAPWNIFLRDGPSYMAGLDNTALPRDALPKEKIAFHKSSCWTFFVLNLGEVSRLMVQHCQRWTFWTCLPDFFSVHTVLKRYQMSYKKRSGFFPIWHFWVLFSRLYSFWCFWVPHHLISLVATTSPICQLHKAVNHQSSIVFYTCPSRPQNPHPQNKVKKKLP